MVNDCVFCSDGSSLSPAKSCATRCTETEHHESRNLYIFEPVQVAHLVLLGMIVEALLLNGVQLRSVAAYGSTAQGS